jgi:putative component of membrane protein insertase Oxa1/YidC/SpoIIIJ protein YidD
MTEVLEVHYSLNFIAKANRAIGVLISLVFETHIHPRNRFPVTCSNYSSFSIALSAALVGTGLRLRGSGFNRAP